MAIADLKNVLNIFGGSELSQGQQDELRKEVLLMTLARAADADINIQTVEVDRIREILKERTGEDFSAADVRVAARSDLYAEANLRKYLGSVTKKLWPQDRVVEPAKALGLYDSGGVVRIGAVHYNTVEEIDATLTTLEDVLT